MQDIVDFYFEIANQLWAVIVSQWILSIGILIVLIGWVITLVNGSRQN